jgi:hypothetical protein
MPDADYFKQKAQRCRELERIAVMAEVREQLRLWAEEFDAQAEGIEVLSPSARSR